MSFMNGQPWLEAKRAQNYMPAFDRPACRNCAHATAHARVDSTTSNYRCAVGSFMTTAMAVCERHQLARPAHTGS